MLIDGVKYTPWTPKEENQLEEIVKEHTKDIFGEDSIYFEKRKISSELGIRAIPDGFVINFRSKRLYVIEIELSTHKFDHVFPQGRRHIDAMRDFTTKEKLVELFYNEIENDSRKKLLAKNFVDGDLHRFLTHISKDPELVIVVDSFSNEIDQAGKDLSARIVEFKTFEREGVGLSVHAHLFEPLIKLEKLPDVISKADINITPTRKYRVPILEALDEMHGRGKVKDVLEKVEAKMKDKLTENDYKKIPSGTILRWRNHAMWERMNMKLDGLLKEESPRGIWEITDKGQNYLKNMSKS